MQPFEDNNVSSIILIISSLCPKQASANPDTQFVVINNEQTSNNPSLPTTTINANHSCRPKHLANGHHHLQPWLTAHNPHGTHGQQHGQQQQQHVDAGDNVATVPRHHRLGHSSEYLSVFHPLLTATTWTTQPDDNEVFTLPGLFCMESMWNPWNPSRISYGIHGMNVGWDPSQFLIPWTSWIPHRMRMEWSWNDPFRMDSRWIPLDSMEQSIWSPWNKFNSMIIPLESRRNHLIWLPKIVASWRIEHQTP